MIDDDIPITRRAIFWAALRTALGRTPVWLFCWLVPMLLALVLAVPWRGWIDGAVQSRYEPGSVLVSMNEVFRFDHERELSALRRGTAGVAAALAFVAVLFGVFSGGGWLQVVLERTQGHSLRRFLWGGARYFWRFARVFVLTLGTLGFAGWVLHGWPWKTALRMLFGAQDGGLDVLESELSAVLLTWLQAGLYAFAFALILVWGDYTRTRMALQNTRSALWAGLMTWGLILWHPLRTLRPFALLLAIEALILWVLGTLSWGVNTELSPQSGWIALSILLVLGQVALLWQGISRGARYHAAVQVSRALVPPLLQPDPWAGRVGGPGGPQYPIDVTDDYGVSV